MSFEASHAVPAGGTSLPAASPLPLGGSRPLVPVPAHSKEALHLLDDANEWSAFSKSVPHAPQCWESSVVIEGMHCAACALTIEEALQSVPGVQQVQVSGASHRARIVWSSEQVLPSQWMQAVQERGYRAVPANDVFASDRRKRETRKALWRMGVAGLCMMQVMMYAYPAYTAQSGDLSAEMEQLLRWASWVLSLPVMLFSCGPFFSNALRDIRHGQVSMDLPVALGMAITFAVSTVGTFEPLGKFGREVYFDSLTMFVFFLLTGRWLELRLRDRTAGALEALMNRLPDSIERQDAQGTFERVAVRRLQVGDLVRVHPGEAIAADGVVELGSTLVDEALLTGESHPLPRGVGESVVAGSHNLSATIHVRIQQVGAQTRFAQIVALMESAAISKPTTALLADRLAKPFLVAVLLAALAACAWWWGRDPEHALMVAVAVLVVTCPCALSLATPAAMLAAAGTLARRGVLVRNLAALEALSQVDTVVFDKTGTLTRDTLVLGQIEVRSGVRASQALQMAGALAAHSLHPASRALHAAAVNASKCAVVQDNTDPGEARLASASDAPLHCESAEEVAGQGVAGWVQGEALRIGSAAFCGLNLAQSARVQVHLSDASGWLASFEMKEDLRPEAREAVHQLLVAGLKVQLLSGDDSESVRQVAHAVGIQNAQGGCTPQDKLDALRQLQCQGQRVVMVGDGLNDGPVLAGAHASFAFGKAVPLAQARSDFVVLGEQLQSVPQALLLARKTMRVVRQNLWWALLYNAACVPLAVFGFLPAWLAGLGMACSSLLVVMNALRLTEGASRPKET